MRKLIFLLGSLFFIFTLNVWAQGNHYFIKVKISEDMKEASGIQHIDYVNPNDYSLEKLYFCTTFPHDDKAQCQIQKITEVGGAELPFSPSNDYPGIFEVKLRPPLKSKGNLRLIMQFSVPVSYRSHYIFGSLRHYWHPKAVPYYKGKLQPYNREIASYHVEVNLPSEKTIVTSGEIESIKEVGKGVQKITYRASNITNFGLFFFDEVDTKEFVTEEIKITTYFSPSKAGWTENLGEIAADVVRCYIKEIGFYPQKIINIIPGSKSWTGGFPIASNIFAIHTLAGTGKGYGRVITAHEIAHYYWGFDYVLVPGEYSDWLAIALGMYTDDLYLDPESKSRYSHHNYLLGALMGYDTTIMQKMEKIAKVDFNRNSIVDHGKSLSVIKMVEYLVGKDTFRRIHDTLLTRYKYKVLTAEDFQAVCEEISGQKLDWFFQPWLYTNNKLDYIISQVKIYKKDDKFLTKIEVKKTGQIAMPIEIEITTIDDKKYTKVFPRELDEGWLEFIIPTSLKDVILDPLEKLPLISRVNVDLKQSMAIEYFNKGKYYQSLNLIDEILNKFKNELDIAYILYFQGQAFRKLGRYEKALQSFQKVVDLAGKNEFIKGGISICHVHRGYIFDLQGQRESAISEYKKALSLPDYRGAHSRAKKYLEEPFKEDEE